MPDEPEQNCILTGSGDLVGIFQEIMGELGQYLRDQRALGITHVTVGEEIQKTVVAWGTREWKKHRFTCQGPADARIMIVDGKGGFFRGNAGRLLVKILKAMHLTEDSVYICNAVDLAQIKCRVEQIRPSVVITLGREASSLLLGGDQPLEKMTGRFHSFCGVKVMPTRHPAELLENPGLKRGVWEDMQKVMAEAGLDHGG